MNMDIPFTESRPLRIHGSRPALRRENVLSTLIRQMSGWISARLAAHRSIVELSKMDDRMLRDIGLRRDQIEGMRLYGQLPEA